MTASRRATLAALWMAAAVVFGTAVAGFFRAAAEDVHPLAIPFYRALFALPLVLPWLFARHGGPGRAFNLLPRAAFVLHFGRAASVVGTIVFFVWAMESITIADATALVLLGPVFAAALAALFLRERAGARGWGAMLAGLAGAALVVGPSGEGALAGAGFALLSAVLAALDWIFLKRIAERDGMGRATAWLTVLMVPLALPPALLAWSAPDPQVLAWLAGAAVAGTISQALSVRAFALGRLWHLSALAYLNVPLAAAMGWAVFAETIEPATLAGGALIVAAAVVLAQRAASATDDDRDRRAGDSRPIQ